MLLNQWVMMITTRWEDILQTVLQCICLLTHGFEDRFSHFSLRNLALDVG